MNKPIIDWAAKLREFVAEEKAKPVKNKAEYNAEVDRILTKLVSEHMEIHDGIESDDAIVQQFAAEIRAIQQGSNT